MRSDGSDQAKCWSNEMAFRLMIKVNLTLGVLLKVMLVDCDVQQLVDAAVE